MKTKNIFNHFIAGYRGFSPRTWVIIFATFIDSIGTSIAIFLALYLSIILKMPVEQVGFIISTFGVGAFGGSYLGGFLCDRFSYHKISVLMLLASGTMTSLIPLFSHFLPLLGVVGLAGLFYGSFKPANTLNLLSESHNTDRARINGLYRVAANLGMGAASLIGGLIVSFHFSAVFWFDGLTSWIAAIILFYVYRSSVPSVKNNTISKSFNTKFFDKKFIWLCVLLLINCLVFFQIRTTYPLFLNEQYHINARGYGYLFLLNCLMIVFFEVPILNSVKHINQVIIASLGSLFICLGMFILPFGNNLTFAILSCLVLTIGEILLFSTMIALILDRANESNKGKYIGVYQSMFSLASMLAPIFGSFLYARQPNLVWYFCGIIGLISILSFIGMNLSLNKTSVITENA